MRPLLFFVLVSECQGVRMALELSAIVGIVLMAIGSIMVLWGLLLCYTTKVTFLRICVFVCLT